jgi:hypothetical protein
MSPLLIGLTILFFFASAISTLDKRLTQGKRAGTSISGFCGVFFH